MKEISAGGVILVDRKILLVKVKNLSGKIVWTFPKGHIEKGETITATAKREVLEETGYKCELIKYLKYKSDLELLEKIPKKSFCRLWRASPIMGGNRK